MGGAEVLAQAWKEWGLQALVLLSFTLQVVLLVLAEFRRHMDSGALRFFIWSAYMMADTTAIYVLGHLSVTIWSPEDEVLALWAPFLVLHLGGQDKKSPPTPSRTTSCGCATCGHWPSCRWLQPPTSSMAYGTVIVVIGNSRRLLILSVIAIFMFVIGVVKYGERVWALRCAGSSPTGNYQSDIGIRRFSLGVPESFIGRLDPAEAFLLNAHQLLDFAKDRFKGPLPCLFLCGPSSPGSQLHGEEELYKLTEMQLSLLHDVFYTKAEVTHTWYGLSIRVLSWLATAIAFLLFNILLSDDHHHNLKGYRTRDVTVTYVLFVGAVVLETMSLLRIMFSS
ncbi:hypothetical protein C2845_PM16G01010 [Panicum miliaceum]|uniref:DUF4220 domain-containing protein n=1 Tax=Panicum miliaceum TaxID=4540 RepID=A0A3L6PVB4_PANMI|nr:hypothetical protein C2845_PM16G01010 [Panicum miliaceum]